MASPSVYVFDAMQLADAPQSCIAVTVFNVTHLAETS